MKNVVWELEQEVGNNGKSNNQIRTTKYIFQSLRIFLPQQVLPEEAGQKGAYYNSGGDQRVGRWGEEERVIQLVTSDGSCQINPSCCSSEASFSHWASIYKYDDTYKF